MKWLFAGIRVDFSEGDIHMRHQHYLRTLLALLVLFIGSLRVKADDVIDQIPDDALAYVVVKNMQQAGGAISQVAQRMQLPAPDLLQMAKQRLNLVKGVADTGDMALVLVGRLSGSPVPVVFLRTTNYEELLSQLNPVEQEGQISRVNLGGETTLMAKKGAYAVLTSPLFRDGLQQVIESKASVQRDDRQQAFTQQAQLYAVVADSGVKLLSQQAIAGLQMLKQNLSQAEPQAETVVAGLAVYEELFKWASKEVRQVVLALRMDDSGAVALMKRVDFQNSVECAVGGSAASATKQLTQLPTWPYVMAFAGELGDSKAMEKWIQLSIDLMRAMPAEEKLTDEQIEKLVEVSHQSMAGVRGMSFTFGVPQQGDSIFSRMAIVMQVKDANAYINEYLQAMQQMREIFADHPGMPYRIVKAEKVQVADGQGMKVVMQILPDAFGPGDDQSKEMFNSLLGTGGTIEVYAAPVDANRVALAYASEENLREVMQAAKEPLQGLGTAEGVQTTAQLLPDKAQWVGFISPQGMLQYLQRMIETLIPQEQREQIPQIPDFPSSPPLGFSLHYDGQSLEVGLIAPAESLTALGQYVQAIQRSVPR